MKINLRIMTPNGEFYKGEVESIHVKTTNGYITILPEHFPLLTSVVPSVISYTVDGERKKASVASGILHVKQEETLMLVDAIEYKDQIDIKRAEEALKRAKQRLEKKTNDIDVIRAEAALQRAIARIKVYNNQE